MDRCEVQGTELRQWLQDLRCFMSVAMLWGWHLVDGYSLQKNTIIFMHAYSLCHADSTPHWHSLWAHHPSTGSALCHWTQVCEGLPKMCFSTEWKNVFIFFFSIQVLHTHSVYGWSPLAMRLIWRLSKYGKGTRYCVVFTLMWAWVYPGLVG